MVFTSGGSTCSRKVFQESFVIVTQNNTKYSSEDQRFFVGKLIYCEDYMSCISKMEVATISQFKSSLFQQYIERTRDLSTGVIFCVFF